MHPFKVPIVQAIVRSNLTNKAGFCKNEHSNYPPELNFAITMMKTGKNAAPGTVISITCLLIVCLLIKLTTFFPLWIERNYSQGVYPYISIFYRTVFGWIPFSIGDVLYAIAAIYLLTRVIKTIRVVTSKPIRQINFASVAKRIFYIVAAIYIWFNLSWGLNYNRPGIAYQLQLNPQVYNRHDLDMITHLLLLKVNESRLGLGRQLINYKPYHQLFDQAKETYRLTGQSLPFLQYNTGSIKKSMYGRLGNMLGFLGYYNPFTGEAQLNLTMPRFLIPYVSCHEMAHQLGYASESEANFVGYLSAVRSADTLFHYSAYFDMFNYANGELFLKDSVAAKNNYYQLDTLVKGDVKELRDYWQKSDNFIEPLIKIFYDSYLKANQQSEGVKSYNEVTGWLIAYYKKYGKI